MPSAEPSPKASAVDSAHEQQRVRQPLQHDVEHRPLEGRRPAEIEPQEGGHIGEEPLQRALVEAPFGAQLGDAFRVGAAGAGEIGVDRVARRRLQQQERADRDDRQDREERRSDAAETRTSARLHAVRESLRAADVSSLAIQVSAQ